MSSPRPLLTTLALAALTLLGFAGSAPREDDGWARVLPDLELSYPRDHGAHRDHRTEWWYLTGNVRSDDGRRFGYQFTIFRNGLLAGAAPADAASLRAREVFAGHVAITDVESGQTLFAERLRRGGTPLAHASDEELDVGIEGWSLRADEDDTLRLAASDPGAGIALELSLSPMKSLVLHGEGGYSRKGADPGNASAYASWTRLGTSGRLTVDGTSHAVSGASWFDHEFGSSVLDDGVEGWDWFGLQLDDGRDLMLFTLRESAGGASPASAGTLVRADGTTRALARADFRIEILDRWTSPRTGSTYPARWRLSIPSEDLTLIATPLVSDAELHTGGSTDVVYWEGPVALEGGATGHGYAELTGYGGSMAGRF